jgi:hypothetical protein
LKSHRLSLSVSFGPTHSAFIGSHQNGFRNRYAV